MDTDADLTGVVCYIDGAESSYSSVNGYLQDKTSGFTITIGASLNLGQFANFFKGFLYSLKIMNEEGDLDGSDMDGSSNCIGTCNFCPLT